jgi:predicted Ser/Thr protein kinase
MEISLNKQVDRSSFTQNHGKTASFTVLATALGVGLVIIGLVGKSHHWGRVGTLAAAEAWTVISGGAGVSLSALIGRKQALEPQKSKEVDMVLLGQGAFGAVYKTTWQGQTVALKKSHDTNEKPAFIKGMIFGTMGIPCMVQHYDYMESEDGFSGVMEYIDGQSLLDYEISPEAERTIMKSFLEGYKSMLERGVVPGDVHAENVMVTGDQNVRFIDFDYYSFIGEKAKVKSLIYQIGMICKGIKGDFDTLAFEGSLNNKYFISDEPQELTQEIINALLEVIDAELQKLG